MPKRMTISDHQRLGPELFELRNRLLSVAVEVYGALPKSSASAKAAHRAVAAVDRLRCELDNEACGLPEGSPRIYYPGPTSKDAE